MLLLCLYWKWASLSSFVTILIIFHWWLSSRSICCPFNRGNSLTQSLLRKSKAKKRQLNTFDRPGQRSLCRFILIHPRVLTHMHTSTYIRGWPGRDRSIYLIFKQESNEQMLIEIYICPRKMTTLVLAALWFLDQEIKRHTYTYLCA